MEVVWYSAERYWLSNHIVIEEAKIQNTSFEVAKFESHCKRPIEATPGVGRGVHQKITLLEWFFKTMGLQKHLFWLGYVM